jgi:hypothetical protein
MLRPELQLRLGAAEVKIFSQSSRHWINPLHVGVCSLQPRPCAVFCKCAGTFNLLSRFRFCEYREKLHKTSGNFLQIDAPEVVTEVNSTCVFNNIRGSLTALSMSIFRGAVAGCSNPLRGATAAIWPGNDSLNHVF